MIKCEINIVSTYMYRVSTLNQHIFIISFYQSLFDSQVAEVGEELVVTQTGEEVEQHSGEEEVEVVAGTKHHIRVEGVGGQLGHLLGEEDLCLVLWEDLHQLGDLSPNRHPPYKPLFLLKKLMTWRSSVWVKQSEFMQSKLRSA